MDANYFIAKFSAIPDNEWCTGALSKHEVKGDKPTGRILHCALGHCAVEERYVLRNILEPVGALSPTYINDGWHVKYRQAHPKERILAALNDVRVANGLA